MTVREIEASEGQPMRIQVAVETPTEGLIEATAEATVSVGDFVEKVMGERGVESPSQHDLEVPLDAEGHRTWFPVHPDETLLDALRGVTSPPRIVFEREASHYSADQVGHEQYYDTSDQ